MKIAIIGYGKMGKTVERIAETKGHTIVSIIDKDNTDDFKSEAFASADAAIEFTEPDAAMRNIETCFEIGTPVVCGTTGRISEPENMAKIEQMCKEKNGTFIYSSNYGLGVNILFLLNKELARIMSSFPEYDVTIEEIHHIHKLDAPSGTAKTLAEEIIKVNPLKTGWSVKNTDTDKLRITAVRRGEVPGTHIVSYDSAIDAISISHESKNRDGLAAGAVTAAEFIKGKKGVFSMRDILKF